MISGVSYGGLSESLIYMLSNMHCDWYLFQLSTASPWSLMMHIVALISIIMIVFNSRDISLSLGTITSQLLSLRPQFLKILVYNRKVNQQVGVVMIEQKIQFQ